MISFKVSSILGHVDAAHYTKIQQLYMRRLGDFWGERKNFEGEYLAQGWRYRDGTSVFAR